MSVSKICFTDYLQLKICYYNIKYGFVDPHFEFEGKKLIKKIIFRPLWHFWLRKTYYFGVLLLKLKESVRKFVSFPVTVIFYIGEPETLSKPSSVGSKSTYITATSAHINIYSLCCVIIIIYYWDNLRGFLADFVWEISYWDSYHGYTFLGFVYVIAQYKFKYLYCINFFNLCDLLVFC